MVANFMGDRLGHGERPVLIPLVLSKDRVEIDFVVDRAIEWSPPFAALHRPRDCVTAWCTHRRREGDVVLGRLVILPSGKCRKLTRPEGIDIVGGKQKPILQFAWRGWTCGFLWLR